MTPEFIKQYFSKLSFDDSWSFAGLSTKDTTYISHGYHRYPAKFIPQLARRLIKEYTRPGDLICDPFMGSGTALIEAIISGRRALGVDINPVAWLISKVKTTPLKPSKLEKEFALLVHRLNLCQLPLFNLKEGEAEPIIPSHERIDYWFPEDVKLTLGKILASINTMQDEDFRHFFLCGFSHILKNCSIWLMRSTKPTRDFEKVIPHPIRTFITHIEGMIRKNQEFWQLIDSHNECIVECADARSLPTGDVSVNLIVTSPPYVTSYEYADIHQLTVLWLGYTSDLKEFRQKFIGTTRPAGKNIIIDSRIGEDTIAAFEKKSRRKAEGVATYFSEMRECFQEMWRVLKPGGKACIVIGNTSYKGVEVLNAEIFVEQMIGLGFGLSKVIKRKIPSKILPQFRDPETGRFTSPKNPKAVPAYPHEFIMVMEKEK